MNRLNNSLKQRDAAREEALLSKEELKKLQEEVESGALVPRAAVAATAAAAAASATPAATPTPAPAPSAQYDPGRIAVSPVLCWFVIAISLSTCQVLNITSRPVTTCTCTGNEAENQATVK